MKELNQSNNPDQRYLASTKETMVAKLKEVLVDENLQTREPHLPLAKMEVRDVAHIRRATPLSNDEFDRPNHGGRGDPKSLIRSST